MFSYSSYADLIDRHGEITLVCALVSDVVLFSAIAIEAAPDQHVDIEIALAKEGIGFQLAVVASCCFRVETVNVASLFGDDVDNGSECDAAVE